MPTYEYRCDACGHRFEAFQKMSDEPVETCPECGEPEAERQMSAGAGLVFKGSGFYETDYKRSGGDEGADGGSGEGSAGSDASGDGSVSSSSSSSSDPGSGDAGES